MITAHATGSAVPSTPGPQPTNQATSTPATTQTHTPNTHIKHTHLATTQTQKPNTKPSHNKTQPPQTNPNKPQRPQPCPQQNPQQNPTQTQPPTKPTPTKTKISAHGFGSAEKKERKRGERGGEEKRKGKGREEGEKKEKYQHTGSNRGLHTDTYPLHPQLNLPYCNCPLDTSRHPDTAHPPDASADGALAPATFAHLFPALFRYTDDLGGSLGRWSHSQHAGSVRSDANARD